MISQVNMIIDVANQAQYLQRTAGLSRLEQMMYHITMHTLQLVIIDSDIDHAQFGGYEALANCLVRWQRIRIDKFSQEVIDRHNKR